MAKSISSYNGSQFSTLVFLFPILGFLNLSCAKISAIFWHNCTNSSSFAPSTTFQLNLATLLSSLSSKAASSTTDFYNTTTFGGANTKETFYGLFMCRGDITPQTCGECVTNSTQTLASMCPFNKEAVIWHEQCLVRYSNRSFFSTMEEQPVFCLKNKEDYGGPLEQFHRNFRSLMEDLLNQASDPPVGSRKFAVKKKMISEENLLFGLAQCTPDLSRDDCRQCLEDAVAYLQNSCAVGKIGGRVLYPSCLVRYEPYIFYSDDLLGATGKRNTNTPSLKMIIIVVATVILVVIFCFGWCLMTRKARKNLKDLKESFKEEIDAEMKPLQFDLGIIQDATNDFSDENKVGAGGFGEVYKGTLFSGQEIAVKRLSRNSKQGAVEFMNEVLLIAKLQHRNLVRLLGFSMEEEQKILVYEFVHNKSLDYYIFSPQNQRLLTWSECYKIIGGIARGILYLHEDSHLKIIHRDLKPSNILLDGGMNPKISDFGMAKIVAMDQNQGNTHRIAGTYGYMSPEYAMHGQFSIKSDVFSFGVMVLEIVTGKRNAYFDESNYEDLLSYAWKKWRDQRPLELLDPRLQETFSEIEVTRCIQIGLLCVQENPDDRPTMATIALYFNFLSVDLPLPREPAFFMHGKTESSLPNKLECAESLSYSTPVSVNEMEKSMSKFGPSLNRRLIFES